MNQKKTIKLFVFYPRMLQLCRSVHDQYTNQFKAA